jgi:TonB family protein
MIRASIVLLVAYAVIPLLRRRSAAERHALWTTALATAAILPVLTWLLPAWEPDWAQRAADQWPNAFATPPAIAATGDIVVRATGIESGQLSIVSLLPVLWVGGSIVCLIALLVQARRLKRLASSALPTEARHQSIAADVAQSLGLTSPRLARSDRIRIPLAWGLRRARILLPDASRDWSDERVWAVCAHELAHISRGDWVVHLLTEIVCRIYWFHPLFWIARNRVGRESERAADDIVIGLGASGADYASHLIAIVRASQRGTAAPAVAMARRSGLEHRIAALLNGVINRARVSRARACAILAGASLVTVPLAALSTRHSATIEIRTSNLPPVEHIAVREMSGDDHEPVRDIRVVNPASVGREVPPSIVEYTTPPLYSDEARRRGIEGVVVARAHIDANGEIGTARITQGLGFGLDQNALVALRQWRFRPGTRNGVAASMDVEIDIGFTLRNDAVNAQIANDMVSLVGPGVTPPQVVRVMDVRLRRVGTAGTVVLDVVLLEDGTPRIVRILRSLGADADDMAVRIFEQWRFSPAQQDGRPIKVRMNAEVTFHG